MCNAVVVGVGRGSSIADVSIAHLCHRVSGLAGGIAGGRA